MKYGLFSLFCFIAASSFAQAPVITSVNPGQAPLGSIVIINGSGFDTLAQNNIVRFGTGRGIVNAASTTQLSVTMPAGTTFDHVSVINIPNNLTAYYSTPVSSLFQCAVTPGIDSSSFSQLSFATGNSPRWSAIGDLNGDNLPEVVSADYYGSTISIFQNSSIYNALSASSLILDTSLATGTNPRCVELKDVNSDGKPDVIFTNEGSSTFSVYINTSSSGNFGFQARLDFSSGTGPYTVGAADLNKDGKPDFVVANKNSNDMRIYENISSGSTFNSASLAPAVLFSTGSPVVNASIADLDGDGNMDITTCNSSSSSVWVYANLGNTGTITSSSFAAPLVIGTGAIGTSVTFADLNADQKPELIATTYTDNYLSIINNTSSAGAISFGARVDFTTGTAPYRAAVGDYDSDGMLDVAVANSQSDAISVFRNIHTSGAFSASSFAPKIDFSTGATPYFLCSGDLDSDSDYELVSADFNSSTLTVYKNLLNTCAPSPSCGITAALIAAADSTGSLTYMFVGSSSGGTMTSQSLSINSVNVSSGQDTVYYTFPAAGVYEVCYTVMDSTFSPTCSNQFCIDSLYVGPVNCVAVIQPTDNGGGSFTFTAAANTPSTWLTSYSWNFGDGAVAGVNPGTHQYASNGTYTVSLTTNSVDPLDSINYCSSTDTVSVNVQGVTAPGCSAGFVIWADTANPSLYYGFNTSTGTNLYYLWDFGDGTTSTLQFPMHNYAAPGFYQLCLTVTDSISCTNTYCDSAGVFRISSSAPGISQLTILPNSTAVQENHSGFAMSLYPNPVTDNSVMSITTDKTMKLTIAIVNTLGELISSEQVITAKGENAFRLKTAALAGGIYFLHITEGNSTVKSIRFAR